MYFSIEGKLAALLVAAVILSALAAAWLTIFSSSRGSCLQLSSRLVCYWPSGSQGGRHGPCASCCVQ